MTTFAYDVILNEKYSLAELLEGITLEEALDEISYRASATLAVSADFPGAAPGQTIRVRGIPFRGTGEVDLLHPAVVWECENGYSRSNRITITMYDRTIYLAKSEDEYLFSAGQTASERLRQYAKDWGIPLGLIPDTGVKLGKAIYRSQSIHSMLMQDLKETVKKGGAMYRPRMTASGLELAPIGGNVVVWSLEPGDNVQDITQKRTLEGTITQVKVLGSGDDSAPSKVLVIEKGETDTLGTLQKIVQDSKLQSPAEARVAAKSLISGIQETLNVTAIDINTIRAGDRVDLAGSGMELIAMSVRHELGDPGKMVLELASPDYVKRRYYFDESV